MTYPNTSKIGALACVLLATPHLAAANSTFDFYGQLNFGIFSTDDGEDSETYFADNDNSNTRVGFNWNNEFGDGSSLRFNFESSLGLTGSSSVNIDDQDFEFEWDKTELRKFEFIYKTPKIGTFYFGQGSMSVDGITEADFSGTSVIAYSGISDLAGGFEFRDNDGGFTGVTIGNAFSSFDGARRFRLRYDTPAWNNFVFSISGGEEVLDDDNDNEYYGIAATYFHDYGDWKVDARLGYDWVGGAEEIVAGSVAALHDPTGLSVALSSGSRNDNDIDYIYFKFGWQQDWFSLGKTALSVDYNDGENYALDGSDSNSVGIAAVQNIDDHNLELYAAWRTHEFDASGSSFQDIDVFAVGARWKF